MRFLNNAWVIFLFLSLLPPQLCTHGGVYGQWYLFSHFLSCFFVHSRKVVGKVSHVYR